jgi:hypothetical protein
MKKHVFLLIFFLFPVLIFSQNVGIGTNTPVAKLDIFGIYNDPIIPGITSNGILRISATTIGDALDIGKKNGGTYDAWLQAGFFGNADPISLQPLGGNVGIGLLSPSAKLEVEGGIKADSLDVQSGLIRNVGDPISAQDAATKAYVDLLESTIDALESKVAVLMNFLNLSVQQRLDSGETPIEIYNSDNSLLDSLYGKTYQGGFITYLNTVTGTGLVAAPVDQSVGTWGCYGLDIPDLPNVPWNGGNPVGPGAEVGDGATNTAAILNGCTTSGIAASICAGYDDGTWFLPSAGELDLMYTNLHQALLGGFSSGGYWSSTEFGDGGAWLQDFVNGGQTSYVKFSSYFVRAVRAF